MPDPQSPISKSIKSFQSVKDKRELPVVALRDAIIFPGIAMPILVQRPKSLAALDFAMKHDQLAFFVSQKTEETDHPSMADMYMIGTVGKIKEMGRGEDGAVRVLVEGVMRAKILGIVHEDPFVKVRLEPLPPPSVKKTEKIEALMYSSINQFREIV